jgi:tetraacyldisaccharide 4'-kinase
MIRPLLTPLNLIYAAALHLKNARYERAEPGRLSFPVISVGNISVGGSGKTPLVLCLAQLLESAGFQPDVLSRGYGRMGKGAERVDPDGDAERFGDEPLLIARVARVPVFVGASRFQAGLLAEAELPATPSRVHLLDDGFQHRQLARSLDIVAMHPSDLTGMLLPAGRLREPLTSLRRADVIVLREQDAALAAKIAPYARQGTHFWTVRRILSLQKDESHGKRVLAFCAIARPGEFFRSLEASGSEVAARASFRDHHRYTEKDMEGMCRLALRRKCEEFVATEKDAVKLTPAMREKLAAVAPLRVQQLRLEIVDQSAALRVLTEALRKRS